MQMRRARDAAFRLASVVDNLAVRLNGKQPFPPIHLRRDIGSLRGVELTTGESAAFLALLGGMTPDSRIVDMGCGPGMMALMLRDRLASSGRYVGLEVSRRAVDWAREHLEDERFTFRHHDYWNATFNPQGRRLLAFAVEDGWADIVLMKSILTHMLAEDVAFYLRETARVLAPEGTAIVTAFAYGLVDPEPRLDTMFPHSDELSRFLKPASPESAIAQPANWLVQQAKDAGLSSELLPGYWRGPVPRITTYQDVMLLRHHTG